MFCLILPLEATLDHRRKSFQTFNWWVWNKHCIYILNCCVLLLC